MAADAADYKRGARLRRRLCRRVVSPQGKRLTMICASLVLLQIMFAVHRFAQGATALRAEGCGIAMGPLCDPGSEDAPRGRKGARLCRGLCRRVVHRFAQGATALRAEGCGIALSGDEFYNPPSAVTSTWSIIIILTLVHPFATSWPSSPRESMSLDSQVAIAPLRIQFLCHPKGDARALRDWLSVSYSMISILVISRCAAPPYPAAPDFLHGKACHTILRSLCSLTNRVPLPPHPGDRIKHRETIFS